MIQRRFLPIIGICPGIRTKPHANISLGFIPTLGKLRPTPGIFPDKIASGFCNLTLNRNSRMSQGEVPIIFLGFALESGQSPKWFQTKFRWDALGFRGDLPLKPEDFQIKLRWVIVLIFGQSRRERKCAFFFRNELHFRPKVKLEVRT